MFGLFLVGHGAVRRGDSLDMALAGCVVGGGMVNVVRRRIIGDGPWLVFIGILLYSPVELTRMILIYERTWPEYAKLLPVLSGWREIAVIWAPVVLAVALWLRRARTWGKFDA